MIRPSAVPVASVPCASMRKPTGPSRRARASRRRSSGDHGCQPYQPALSPILAVFCENVAIPGSGCPSRTTAAVKVTSHSGLQLRLKTVPNPWSGRCEPGASSVSFGAAAAGAAARRPATTAAAAWRVSGGMTPKAATVRAFAHEPEDPTSGCGPVPPPRSGRPASAHVGARDPAGAAQYCAAPGSVAAMGGRRAALTLIAAIVTGSGCGGGGEEPSAGAPQWRTLAPAQLERTEVAAARVGRYVYVIGGFEGESGATTAATERYDVRRNRWTRVADLPVPLNHAAAASHRGDVYVVGGYSGATGLTNEVATLYRYDPGRDRWRRLPSMPTARGAMVAGVIGRKLYVAGGASAHRGGALPTLEIYDFRTRRWRAGPDMAVAREHLAGAVAGGRFYALAGRAAGAGNFPVVEAYDPRSGRWRTQPPMRKPRGGIGAATVGGRIVVAGGEETAGTIREVELFNPRTRRWRRLDDMPTPRHGLGVVSRRGRVYTLAGGDEPGFAFTAAAESLRIR